MDKKKSVSRPDEKHRAELEAGNRHHSQRSLGVMTRRDLESEVLALRKQLAERESVGEGVKRDGKDQLELADALAAIRKLRETLKGPAHDLLTRMMSWETPGAASALASLELAHLESAKADNSALREFALQVGQAVYAATDNNGELDPANSVEAIVDRLLKGEA